MNVLQSLVTGVTARLSLVSQVVQAGIERPTSGRERGDVPGWVLITLMTAGLVTILWALAGSQLETLFSSAISSVTGPGAR